MRKERGLAGLWQVPGWEKYDWLCHGFTTTSFGNLALHVGDGADQVIARRRQLADFLGFSLASWVCANQIHETKIVKISGAHRGSGACDLESALPGTDGLINDEPGFCLLVFSPTVSPCSLWFRNGESSALPMLGGGARWRRSPRKWWKRSSLTIRSAQAKSRRLSAPRSASAATGWGPMWPHSFQRKRLNGGRKASTLI